MVIVNNNITSDKFIEEKVNSKTKTINIFITIF